MCKCRRIEASFHLPRAPLGRIVNDLCFLPDNVSAVGCIYKKTSCMGNEKQGRQKTQNTSKIERSLFLNRAAK